MARRGNTSTIEADEQVGTEAETTEAVEAAVEATEEEQATENDEARDTSGDTVHTDGEVEVSLEPFEQASAAAVAQRDTNTGDLPEGALEPVLEAYRALPSTKDRNRAKNWLKDQMKSAMESMDLSLARAFLTMQDSMTTAKAATPTDRKPADPLAVYKHNLLTVLAAYGELAGVGKPEVENVEEVVQSIQSEAASTEFVNEMNEYRAWLDADEPEDGEKPEAPKVRPEVVHAFRIVRGTKRRGVGTGGGDRTPHEGPRRDLGKHIAQAFENLNSGDFLSVAEIRKFRSDEYGDEQPSAGAISARLFPAKGECTIEGITPGTGGEKSTKGAYKD